MADCTVIGAPTQETMESNIDKFFSTDKEGLLVKQTMRGCCQECMGCEAKSEFKIADMQWKHLDGYKVTQQGMEEPDVMYALEQSSCCCRLCWRDGRPFNMKVSEGGEDGGQGIVNFVKPCSFPLYFSIPTKDGSIDCPCCCMLPSLKTTLPDAAGTELGSSSRYVCDINLFVPKLEYAENGAPKYMLKPETCCGGCCIACNCCSGKGSIYIPFYFHDPATGNLIGGNSYSDENVPQIRKLWAGLKKECCSTADTFAVMFPTDASAKTRAGLLGLTFLLDFTVFERQQDNAQ